MLKPVLEHASCLACWWLTGLRGVSLCALAWALRDLPGWRIWVRVADAVLWPHERAHCRQSYERCRLADDD